LKILKHTKYNNFTTLNKLPNNSHLKTTKTRRNPIAPNEQYPIGRQKCGQYANWVCANQSNKLVACHNSPKPKISVNFLIPGIAPYQTFDPCTKRFNNNQSKWKFHSKTVVTPLCQQQKSNWLKFTGAELRPIWPGRIDREILGGRKLWPIGVGATSYRNFAQLEIPVRVGENFQSM
jgi:hypothetical protein